MNKQILKLVAARVAAFLAPLLIGAAVWLGLVDKSDAEKVIALLTSNLTELILGVLLLAAGLIANIRADLRDTKQALELPEKSTLADLAAAKQRARVKRGGVGGGAKPSGQHETNKLTNSNNRLYRD